MSRRRRGATVVQWCVVAAALVLAALAGMQLLGTRTHGGLNNVAGGVGNPATLTKMQKK